MYRVPVKNFVVGKKYYYSTFGIDFEVELLELLESKDSPMCKIKFISILNEEKANVDDSISTILPGIKELVKKQHVGESLQMNLGELLEQEYGTLFITKALKKYKGKRKPAANELGISERTLYRKIMEFGLQTVH